MKNITIVSQPGRSENNVTHTHTYELANILSAFSVVTILCADVDDGSKLHQYDVVEYSQDTAGSTLFSEVVNFVSNQYRMVGAIRQTEPDIVLFYGTQAYVLPILLTSIRERVWVLPRGDVPLSLYLRWKRTMPVPIALVLSKALSLVEHVSYTHADKVLSYSPAMAESLGLVKSENGALDAYPTLTHQLRDALGLWLSYEHKLSTNAARYVDTDTFTYDVPYGDRERTVGFVGRLEEEKDIELIIDVVKQLPDDITFVFVGDGSKREVIESELNGVEVTGWVSKDDVAKHMNRFKMLVVVSHETEGLPTVILEAFACGTPVLATDVAGVPDLVRRRETGRLVKERDAGHIAHLLDIFTDGKNDEFWQDVSQRCIDAVDDGYTYDAAVERWKNICTDTATG